MKIKEVLPNDLENIFELEEIVFKEDAFEKNLIKKLIKKNFLFLKLEKNNDDNELIGFVIVLKDREDTANIVNFLINPKYQNKGHGSFLLKFTIDNIKIYRSIKKIILNVKINSIAINLYQKFNFRIIEKIDNYYRSTEAAYLMELDI